MCEQPDFIDQKITTCRKIRRCVECSTVIMPGRKYLKTAGVWDGRWSHFSQCLVCAWVSWLATIESYDCEGPAFGELKNWLLEGEGISICDALMRRGGGLGEGGIIRLIENAHELSAIIHNGYVMPGWRL